jgi:glutathione S-transferase
VLRARDLLGVPLDSYPSLVDWLSRLAERPSIQAELDVVAAL